VCAHLSWAAAASCNGLRESLILVYFHLHSTTVERNTQLARHSSLVSSQSPHARKVAAMIGRHMLRGHATLATTLSTAAPSSKGAVRPLESVAGCITVPTHHTPCGPLRSTSTSPSSSDCPMLGCRSTLQHTRTMLPDCFCWAIPNKRSHHKAISLSLGLKGS